MLHTVKRNNKYLIKSRIKEEVISLKRLIPHFIEQNFKQHQYYGEFEGYSMFIDLSGFTALTQTLTKKGALGAEHLTIILNQIFEPLVKLVYSQGGFIPYFAGDSFIAIFAPPFSERALDRLTYTAQKARLLYKEQSFLGSFKIGIRIGISQGTIEWGIVGKEKKSFYFRGSAIDFSARSQCRAENEQIIIHENLKSILSDKYEMVQVEEGYFALMSLVADESYQSNDNPRSSLSVDVVAQFMPDSIIKLSDVGEFRTVVSVFISFAGISDYESFNRFATIILDQANNFSAYLKEIDFGDKGGVIPVFFGAPVSFENNTARALEFVISVCEALKNNDFEYIEYRIGISVGTAYTGFIGCEERSQYAVVGNCVNLAARLMTFAEPNEILVDKGIQQSRQFKFHYKGNIQYKGMDGDLPTYALLGRNVDNKFSFNGNLVGRNKELEQMLTFARPLFEHKSPGVIYIHGEAGIGKSRLAFEFRKIIYDELPIAWAVCKADQTLKKGMNPFSYFLQHYFECSLENTAQQNKEHFERKFQSLINKIQQLDRPDIADLLQELQRTKTILAGLLNIEYEYSLWEQLDAKGRFQNVCIALVVLFICESLLRPLVILLEDGHWFDDLSRTFLNDLVRYIPAYPILLIVTSRHTNEQENTLLIDKTVLEEHQLATLDIDLTTLDDEAVNTFTTALLNGEITSDFLNLLNKATNGNPFYLEQMIEYFKESNLLLQRNGQWDIKDKNFELSNSINAILTARLDRLSPVLKETVKAAAAIGQEFDLPILTEVLRRRNTYIFPNNDAQITVLEQVKQAEKDQIWQAVNDVRYAFKHALLREAAYGMQLKTQLKQLHKLIAEAIERVYANKIQYYYFDLAFHYEKAEIAIHADHYLKKAADYARRNFQNKLALKYYNKLLNRIEKSTERVQVLQMRGQILERLGYWELAKDAYAEALALARQINDKYLLGHTNTSYGTLLLLQGNYDDARMHLEVGATFFEFIEDEEGLSKVYGSLGNIYFRQGNYEEARNYFIKSIELARNSISIMPDPQIIAHLGLTCMNQGNYEEGIYWHQQGVEIAEKTNDQLGMANLQTSLGILYFEKGDYTAALACYEKGLKLSKELGDKHLTAITIGNIGRVYERRGDYAKAMESYVKDLEICEELGDKQGQALVNILIGDLYSVLGEFEQSLNFIEKGLQLSKKLGYQKGIARAMNTLGDIYYYKREYQESLVYYDGAIEIAKDINSKLVLGFSLIEKTRTLIALDKIDAAQLHHQEAMIVALALGNPDLIFEVKVLTAKLCVEQNRMLEALQILENLISESKNEWQLAAANYELSKVMPEQQEYALKALELYQEIYEKMPHFLFKERIKELSMLYV